MLERLGRLAPTLHRILLVLGCAVLFGVWLHYVPLTEWDETRYCEATRLMVTEADYLVPEFNGAPRYQKPIFYYWVQAPAVKLLGLNERAARLPSALMVLFTVLLLHGMLLRWLEPRASDDVARARARGAAFLGGAALATMPLLAIWARAAVTDATLTFFTTFTLIALLQADLTEGRNDRRWYLLAAIGAGLAALTKGPIGLAVPGLVWLVYHLSGAGGLRARLTALGTAAKRVPWLPVLALFTLVAAPWYIAITLVDGPDFLQRFLLTENMARYTTVMEGHGSSNPLEFLLLYPGLALLLCFPFSASVLADALQPLGGHPFMQADSTLERIRRFAWVWLLTILVLFTTSQTKLVSYIQAIAPAMALLFALYSYGRLHRHPALAPDKRGRWADGLQFGLLLLLGVLWTGGMAYVMFTGKAQGPLGTVPFPQEEARVLLVTFVVLGVAWIAGMLAMRRRPERQLAVTLTLWLLLCGLMMLEVLPLVVRSQYLRSVRVGHYLRRVPAGEPIVTYNASRSESLVYYSRHVVQFYENDTEQAPAHARTAIQRLLKNAGAITLVTTQDDLAALGLQHHVQLLHREGTNLILRVHGSERP